MTTPVIAIIGAGHMGSSILGGLIKNGHPVDKLIATELNEEKLQQVGARFGVQVTTDNNEAVNKADVVFLSIKPQNFEKVVTPLKDTIQQHKPLVVSIAAGIPEHLIQTWVGGNMPIVRVMPNTPSLVDAGASGLYANEFTSQEQKNVAESIMRAVGITVWVQDEALIDAVTAVSGSGPAYYFLIMEAMQQAGEELGLDKATARLLTQQTILGAAMMATESDKTPAELRHDVTSPGGTTERAISVLEECNIRDIFKKALFGAKERSEEMAKLFGEKK